MSYVKNIKGNKKSQKPRTPQNSIDPELGLKPGPEPSHDGSINAVVTEKSDDEIISAGNEANEKVKNIVKQFSNNELTQDKEEEALLQSENNRDDRENLS